MTQKTVYTALKRGTICGKLCIEKKGLPPGAAVWYHVARESRRGRMTVNRAQYLLLEEYMERCMGDSAHDSGHVRRVLAAALDIARTEPGTDTDVLIAACLLHDIGRAEQLADPRRDHAAVGAEKARRFLTEHGFGADFAQRTADCIRVHRFRTDARPETPEARALFDADKLDVTGAVGIARTLFYQGETGQPLYSTDAAGAIRDGTGADEPPSFFREYRFKLETLYDGFLTARGRELAAARRAAAVGFFEALRSEVAAFGAGTGGPPAEVREK